MNGIAANGKGPPCVGARRHVWVAVPLLMSLLTCTAWAWDEVAVVPFSAFGGEAAGIRPAQFEVSAANLPRFDIDGATRASRIDLTWLPPRRPGLGMAMGMSL